MTIGPEHPTSPPLEAREESEMINKLKNLSGAKVEIDTETGSLIFTIEDQNKWKESIGVLKSIFGKTIFAEYERKLGEFDPSNPDHQTRMQYQCEVSFAGLDKMFVAINEAGEPAGFLAVEDYKGSGIIRDIVMIKKDRGKGMAAELYSLLFKQKKFSEILGYSKNPRAISARQTAGEDNGYSSYFGNQRGGRAGDHQTQLQQKMVEYLTEHGLTSQNSEIKMPAGYVLLDGDQEILPATTAVLPSAASPLIGPLSRLNELQREVLSENLSRNQGRPEGEKKLSDSVAGILVSVRSI